MLRSRVDLRPLEMNYDKNRHKILYLTRLSGAESRVSPIPVLLVVFDEPSQDIPSRRSQHYRAAHFLVCWVLLRFEEIHYLCRVPGLRALFR